MTFSGLLSLNKRLILFAHRTLTYKCVVLIKSSIYKVSTYNFYLLSIKKVVDYLK